MRVADALRGEILSGALAPGAPLREEEIARAHDVSRHTVRAALAALGAERLVQLVPYAGARVSALDDDDLRGLQQLRAALETEAVRLIAEAQGSVWSPATRATIEAAIDDLADAEARADWPATIRAHAAVHRAIVEVADSPRIAQAHAALESEVLLLLTHVRPHYAPGALAAEHRAYLDALPRGGGAAVRAHLDHSTQLIRAAR
ncbi:GntR family transcriptional regulator [Microbacterium hominis]|uniref:GntR family transcriptional regulator n=1 Tax=Microbacterium hominis TaxID=162426 RepID=UPI001E2D92E5|nr:GntR family transcriptional regulator [Microbacterium hominis]